MLCAANDQKKSEILCVCLTGLIRTGHVLLWYVYHLYVYRYWCCYKYLLKQDIMTQDSITALFQQKWLCMNMFIEYELRELRSVISAQNIWLLSDAKLKMDGYFMGNMKEDEWARCNGEADCVYVLHYNWK